MFSSAELKTYEGRESLDWGITGTDFYDIRRNEEIINKALVKNGSEPIRQGTYWSNPYGNWIKYPSGIKGFATLKWRAEYREIKEF